MSTEVKDLNAMSDQELSECFAVEFLDWKRPTKAVATYGGSNKGFYWQDAAGVDMIWPDFATDMNALLPHLEKYEWSAHYRGKSTVMAVRLIEDTPKPLYSATAATFPRAACCALIAACRAAKGATP